MILYIHTHIIIYVYTHIYTYIWDVARLVYKGVWGSEDDMSGRRVELQVALSHPCDEFIFAANQKQIGGFYHPFLVILVIVYWMIVGLPTLPGETSPIEDLWHVVKFLLRAFGDHNLMNKMCKCPQTVFGEGLLLMDRGGIHDWIWLIYDWSPNQRLLPSGYLT